VAAAIDRVGLVGRKKKFFLLWVGKKKLYIFFLKF